MPIKIYESDIIRRDKPTIKIVSALLIDRGTCFEEGFDWKSVSKCRSVYTYIIKRRKTRFQKSKNSCEIKYARDPDRHALSSPLYPFEYRTTVDSLMQCRRANSNSTSIAWNQSHTRTLFVAANTINAASRESQSGEEEGEEKTGSQRFLEILRDLFQESRLTLSESRTSGDTRRERYTLRVSLNGNHGLTFNSNITLHNNKTPSIPTKE